VVFFKSGGAVVALYPLDKLADDAAVSPRTGSGFGGITLAHNVKEKADVAPVIEKARAAGAVVTKPAQDAFWGGHHGYFSDPDGYLWEIAWNPEVVVDLVIWTNLRAQIESEIQQGLPPSGAAECGGDPLAYVACQDGYIVHILNPFDPLVIQRKRLATFFDYEHRFEAYVPKEKRMFGYFAQPVLAGDEIVAVLDLKTDR